MEKKFEKLSLAEIGIISFMGLILLISLGASWYKNAQSETSDTKTVQQVPNQKKTVDTLFQDAENAVIVLEGTHTEEKLAEAQSAVNKVTDATKKAALQKRIDQVKELVGQQTDAQTQAKLKAELVRAEAAQKVADEKKVSEIGTSQSTDLAEASETSQESYVVPNQNIYGNQSVSSTSQYTSSVASTSTSVPPTSEGAPVVETPTVSETPAETTDSTTSLVESVETVPTADESSPDNP
ncbi:serine protease [Streptococcus suis]|uniref:Extracellular serine protease n=1 Tax=Streptococcus suis TaxID=1307 RepID=A0A0Z8NXF8_STRSU|nr:serine protease [Streptococcus suis]NQG29346.1 serine protease [Streptococcus suis]CYW35300.1 extracellular serine protease [Streptococcus suis]